MVKEDQAPAGYVRNTADIYNFKFIYTNDKEAKVSFAHMFSNDRVTAKINLYKVDKETGKAVPQGDAVLKGTVYGLYAREDIVHPDGATGVIYKAGEQVASLTTDEKGQAPTASRHTAWSVSYQLRASADALPVRPDRQATITALAKTAEFLSAWRKRTAAGVLHPMPMTRVPSLSSAPVICPSRMR